MNQKKKALMCKCGTTGKEEAFCPYDIEWLETSNYGNPLKKYTKEHLDKCSCCDKCRAQCQDDI